MMSTSLFDGSSCCGDKIELESTCEVPLDTTDDCCGDDCQGACCASAFTVLNWNAPSEYVEEITNRLEINYSNNYYFSILSAIWQPPRLIKE